MIATKDTLRLVKNESIRGEEELEIEEETFQTFILNSRDQITEVESTEEQPNVRRSTRSRKGRKQDAFDCFLYDDYHNCDD